MNEVARRIAHEIKNPLTPIALCAERIARLLSVCRCRGDSPYRERLHRDIGDEVESVKNLGE